MFLKDIFWGPIALEEYHFYAACDHELQVVVFLNKRVKLDSLIYPIQVWCG